MKFCIISDTHTQHETITDDLIEADCIMHCGDIMSSGYDVYELTDFLNWYQNLDYRYKIFIAGNHDRYIENNLLQFQEMLKNYPDLIYLENSSITLNNIKIYGSPYQPWFYNWAFNKQRGEEIKQEWDKIPEDVDILITHGPAYGYCDKVYGRGNHLGCEELIKRIEQIQPTFHLCGHIHGGSGVSKNQATSFINASVLDEQYKYTYPPRSIELIKLS